LPAPTLRRSGTRARFRAHPSLPGRHFFISRRGFSKTGPSPTTALCQKVPFGHAGRCIIKLPKNQCRTDYLAKRHRKVPPGRPESPRTGPEGHSIHFPAKRPFTVHALRTAMPGHPLECGDLPALLAEIHGIMHDAARREKAATSLRTPRADRRRSGFNSSPEDNDFWRSDGAACLVIILGVKLHAKRGGR
jgi:hypothetical protein